MRRWRFATSSSNVMTRAAAMQDAVTVPDASLRSLGRNLLGKGYQVFVRDTSLYAFKGLAGKYGPLGVHASMLAVMAGESPNGLLQSLEVQHLTSRSCVSGQHKAVSVLGCQHTCTNNSLTRLPDSLMSWL